MSPRSQAVKMKPGLLIRGADLPGLGIGDLRIAGGRIAAVSNTLSPLPEESVLEARGGALLPGLRDHHLHLFATAAARQSVDCGPPAVTDETELATALRQAAARADGWLRGAGYDEAVCDGLDRHWLDKVCPDRPARIQHRSGMLWILNTCALDHLQLSPGEALPTGVEQGADGRWTGRFYNLDEWLGRRLPRAWPDLGEVSRELARHGITGVTDAGARNGPAVWQALGEAADSGDLSQRVLVMGSEELVEHDPPAHPRLTKGPLKIYLREVDLPEYDTLVARIATSHDHGCPIAVHCVTRVEITYLLAALAEAGALPGDRIEHASVADDHALESMAALGVTAVTQPHFIAERGDRYLQRVEPADQPYLYRGRGFIDAGVRLAAGSDAPYGGTNPWAAMRAAVSRQTRGGRLMGEGEALSPEQALGLYMGKLDAAGEGEPGLHVGEPADLCLLDVGRAVLLADLDTRHVAMSFRDGEVIYARENMSVDRSHRDGEETSR